MKVSRSRQSTCVNERETSGMVRLQGTEVVEVQEFKYLGTTGQSSRDCGRELKNRLQAEWNSWRRVSGVIWDRRVSGTVKGKVYRMVVKPAMKYGLKKLPIGKRQEVELEVAELKMLRFSLGLTIQFSSIQFYLYSSFYNKFVSGYFTESEIQSQNPQVSTAARKNSLLTGRNLEQDPAYKEEPSC